MRKVGSRTVWPSRKDAVVHWMTDPSSAYNPITFHIVKVDSDYRLSRAWLMSTGKPANVMFRLTIPGLLPVLALPFCAVN